MHDSRRTHSFLTAGNSTYRVFQSCNRRDQRRRKGAFTVEFAICCSVMFLTVFAGLEFSRFMFVRHAIDQAVFEAARVGIVKGRTATEVVTMANSMLRASGVKPSTATITVTPTTFNDSTLTVRVRVSCPFADNSWLPPRIFGTQPIVSEIELDHENKAYLVPSGGPSIGTNNGIRADTL